MTHIISVANKYQGNYFRHFIGMFAENYAGKKGKIEFTAENVNDMILMIVYIDGEEQLRNMQNEVRDILTNNDLASFSRYEIKNTRDLQFLAELLLKHH